MFVLFVYIIVFRFGHQVYYIEPKSNLSFDCCLSSNYLPYIGIRASEEMLPIGSRHWSWMAFSYLLCLKALEQQLLLLLLVTCQRQVHLSCIALPWLGHCYPAERLAAQGAVVESYGGQNQKKRITWCLQYFVITGMWKEEESLIKCFQKS